MSQLLKENLKPIEESIDVHFMDVKNISKMILEYKKEDVFFSCWSEGKFIAMSSMGKVVGYLPKGDDELFERVKELISLGWRNKNRQIPLDRTSWNMKGDVIRKKIMEL